MFPMSALLESKLNTPISAELNARLEKIAKATGLKVPLLVRGALERQLPDIEKNGITFPPARRDNAETSAAVGKEVA